jgi:hypothetical protein
MTPILNQNETSPHPQAIVFEDPPMLDLSPSSPLPRHDHTSKAVQDYKDNFNNPLKCKYGASKLYKMYSQNCKFGTLYA